MIGENIRVFEMKYFWNNVNTWHWEDLFRFYIGGFVDAHPLFRFFFPEKHSQPHENYMRKFSV